MLPGSRVSEIAVARGDSGWSVRVEADVPVCDLQDLHHAVLRLREIIKPELPSS